VVRRWCGADTVYALWMATPLGGLLIVVLVLVLRVAFSDVARDLNLVDPRLARTAVAVWLSGAALSFTLLLFCEHRVLRLARKGKIGPAVVGVLSPRVYFPADFETRYTPDEQAMIRAHEISHLIRHDVLLNAWVALAQCILWFNPIVHFGVRAFRHDQEMACDAAVMEDHPEQRRRYAAAMLKTQLVQAPMGAACGWAGHPLETRIATLARGTPPAFLRVTVAMAAAALAAATLLITLQNAVRVFERLNNIQPGQRAFTMKKGPAAPLPYRLAGR
jgi:beta-lactamase regulating signal transducer with metallopeptidase domain